MQISFQKKLLALEIKIKSKVGQGVKLFGSINNIDLQKALVSGGFEIDKKPDNYPWWFYQTIRKV